MRTVKSSCVLLSFLIAIVLNCRCDDGSNKTGQSTNTNVVTVYFSGSVTKFGFDNAPNTYDKDYASIAIGDSTKIEIVISSGDQLQYDSLYVESGDPTTLSLSSSKILLTGQETYFSVYALSSGSLRNVQLSVYGKKKDANERSLIKSMWVEIYNEIKYNKLSCIRVKPTNGSYPWFDPITDNLVSGLNKIIRQGVVRVDSVVVDSSAVDWWDLNSNGKLDYYYTSRSKYVADSNPELHALYSQTNRNTFVYVSEIVTNWIVTKHPEIGDTILTLSTTKELGSIAYFIYGSASVFSSDTETIILDKILSDSTIKIATQIRKTHADNETMFCPYPVELGKTIDSDNWSIISTYGRDARAICNTTAHEFMHQNNSGNLQHVTDSLNLMSPTFNWTNLLKYRQIDLSDGTGSQQQWNKMHGF